MGERNSSSLKRSKAKRGRWVLIVGVALLGCFTFFTILGWIAPFVYSWHQSVRRKEIAAIQYPPLPASPAASTTKILWDASLSMTIVSTPEIALREPGESAASEQGKWAIMIGNSVEGRTRTEPADWVSIILHGPPRTWPNHAGRVLRVIAGTNQFRTRSTMDKYDGDVWGLDKRDRLDFMMPVEDFVVMASASDSVISLDDLSWTIDRDGQAVLRDFVAHLRPGIELLPNPPTK